MRHVTISQFGQNLGVRGNRLVVTDREGNRWETALSRLRSIRIEKSGVSVSSNLMLQCALRGIRIFVMDWRHVAVAAMSGCNQHAVVALRKAQFECVNSEACSVIATEFVHAKLRNQRAVLLYFNKYVSRTNYTSSQILKQSAYQIEELSKQLFDTYCKQGWRERLMGIEGRAATVYWTALSQSGLLPESFEIREGRGAKEITNAALNYGYSILQSYVWSALDNAGFELYEGFLHKERIGRASLVMDFMEEYRAWVVDRNIIKLRARLSESNTLSKDLKKEISDAIDHTFKSKLQWHGKSVKLENIIQRQAYRLSGTVIGERTYKGFHFKW